MATRFRGEGEALAQTWRKKWTIVQKCVTKYAKKRKEKVQGIMKMQTLLMEIYSKYKKIIG